MLVRPLWSSGLCATAAFACAPLAFAPPALAQQPRPAPVMRDIAMGLADAPVTIVEYASVTCAACQHFQTDILPRLKARYILSGEAKFVLRDHPTPPAPISFAAFALARCAGESEYYAVIGDFFAKQTEILAATRNGNVRPFVIQIGAAHGLSEADVEACIKNPVLQAYIEKQLDDAPDMTSTPAVFVNDKRIAGFTYEAVAKAVDEALEAARQIEAARQAALPPAPEEVPAVEPLPRPLAPAPPAPAETPAPAISAPLALGQASPGVASQPPSN